MKTLITLSITFFLTTIIQAQTWTNIGPNFGGYLRDFAFHPTNSNKIFVGGDDSAGIWVSEDGGQTWRLVTEELPNMSGWHIEFDKTDTNLLYACDLYNRYGVAKSIDGGETWTTSSNGLNTIGARTVSKIAILNQDTLFISTGLEHDGRTGDGIYKSTDGGLNWNPSGEQGLTCPAIVITQTERLLAATQGQGLHFSDDFGSTWQNHPDISTIDTISQIEIKDSFIVVSTNPSGLYVSSDNGLTFNNIGGAAFDIAIGNTQPNLMIYSSLLLRYEYDYTTNVLVSTNSINNIILTQDTVLYMGIGAKGDTVMLGQLGNSSLSISTDAGNSWINPPTSPAANNINDIAIDPTNPNHIFASLVASNSLGIDKECLIETTNGGNTWVRKGPKESGLKVKFHPVSSDTLLCGTFTGGLYKSVDGGNTWNNLIDSTRIVEIGYNPVYPNEVLVSEINEIASPNYQRLLKSIDGGNTFFQVAPVAVSQIAYIPNSDSIVASVNTAASFNGLFLSTDRGDNWASWTLSGDTIKTVRYHNGSIYAGTESGQLYKVNSSGTQNITGGWNQLTEITNIYWLNNTMYVGLNGAEHDRDASYSNHGGVWYSNDDGQSWTDISNGLTCTQLFSNNVMAELNGKLIVGTYGGSFFTLDALPLGTNSSLFSHQQLEIYPNPVENKLFINLPDDISVDIIECKIFDMIGKLQYASMIEKTSQMQIDLSAFNNGIFLIQFSLPNKIITQKFVKK